MHSNAGNQHTGVSKRKNRITGQKMKNANIVRVMQTGGINHA